MNYLVQINNLTKNYGSLKAIDNLSLAIPSGRIVGLLGPNGSGKTTLIKMLNGLLVPSSGSIAINRFSPGIETKAIVSYLPDRSFLDPGMRVTQILDFFCDFYSDFLRSKAEAMLNDLHIDPHLQMKSLSKGTQEKVQLILVMSRMSNLYVLDEPIAGVDPATRDYIIRTVISNFDSSHSSLLIATHLISDIENILDDVLFIKDGHIVLYDSVDHIRGEYQKSIDQYFREVFAC